LFLPLEWTFSGISSSVKAVELFGSTLVYNEGGAGPFVKVVIGVCLLFYGYVMWLAWQYSRGDTRKKAWPLLVTLGLFLLVAFSDAAVVLGAYRFPYLMEYSWGFFILLMAHSMSLEMLDASRARIALKQSEQQLAQAQKMEAIGRLAGGIAHDFNNLLVPILGYAELAQRRMEPTDQAYEKLTRIREAADQARSLTQQFLAFGRRQVLQMHIVNINDILLGMKRILRHLLTESIQMEFEISPLLGNVKADPTQLQQVVMNLAVNARDAMPSGGTLRICTRDVILDERTAGRLGICSGRYATLSVTDTGMGIAPEILGQVFEPFFSTKRLGQGTGLGLSMVYGIAKQHEGAVTVRSIPGTGSTFEVLLPISGENVTPVPTEEARMPLDCDNVSATVLLVEDDSAVRGLVTELLEENGYKVFSARDGVEGLRIGQQTEKSIDLLLTDVVLPKLDGRELWRRLKQLRPCLKVLFMSGYTDDVMIAPFEDEQGNFPFLSKPFSTDTLIGRVRELLSQKNEGE
jgi:signal transduction histidine kinase/ActR/RegA family two-component response regulator